MNETIERGSRRQNSQECLKKTGGEVHLKRIVRGEGRFKRKTGGEAHCRSILGGEARLDRAQHTWILETSAIKEKKRIRNASKQIGEALEHLKQQQVTFKSDWKVGNTIRIRLTGVFGMPQN